MLVVAVAAVPIEAGAAVGDCTASGETHLNTSSHRKFKIDLGSGFPGMTADSEVMAIIAGAMEWNESAGSGTFEYAGTVSLPNGLPHNDNECDAAGIDYNLVKVWDSTANVDEYDSEPGRLAVNRARCEDSNDDGERFQIDIFLENKNRGVINWGNIASDPAEPDIVDLQGVVTHEFGHAFNLGHSPTAEGGVLGVNATGRGELYQWDIVCARTQGGARALTGYRRFHQSSGALGSEASFTSGITVSRAVAGLTETGGSTDWSGAVNLSSGVRWNLGLNSANFVSLAGISSYNSMGIRAGMWRESSTSDWVSYPYYQDTTPYDPATPHQVRIVTTSNDFSTFATYVFRHCTSMTGFLTCANTATIHSGAGIATAWLDGSFDRSVVAWVNQNRANDDEDGEIMIAVGRVNDYTLPVPYATGLRASGAVSVACYEDFDGANDCILEYTNRLTYGYTSTVRRFSVGTPANTYPITMQGPYTLATTTRQKASALWRSSTDGKFYLALAATNIGAGIGVWSSSNAVTWGYVGGYGSTVKTGLSTASIWRGSGHPIVYAR